MQEPKQETFRTIEGKVAKILNNRELAMNRGRNQGVELGMKFAVIEDLEVLDPDTKQQLGSVNRESIRVKVVQVFDDFSIAQTYQTYRVPSVADSVLLASLAPRLGRTTNVRTIQSPGASPDSTAVPIKIGDRVLQVEKDE